MKENPFEDATSEKEPLTEFLKVLNREPTETNQAMQNGIDFENLVTDIVNGEGDATDKWYDAAEKIARIVRGGQLQCKASKEIEVSGMTFILYGRLDALKAGVIYDIKFSKSYDVGKYFSSTQHPTYFELIPEADEFTYLVSNGSAVWPETYRRDEARSIVPYIADFISWLEVQGLLETYKSKWVAK
jgi:hypothetical protein